MRLIYAYPLLFPFCLLPYSAPGWGKDAYACGGCNELMHLAPPTQFILPPSRALWQNYMYISLYTVSALLGGAGLYVRARSGKIPPFPRDRVLSHHVIYKWAGLKKKMAAVGEDKGWTFDAFDPGTLRELERLYRAQLSI